MKVLVAEDEEIMLLTISAKLKNEGFEVVGVGDGREALKILENFTPDIIITDIMMPYISGLELISIVKAGNTKIPIIVLSGLGQENTVMEAFQLGADDFITKPFNPNELFVRVKRLLKISNTSVKVK